MENVIVSIPVGAVSAAVTIGILKALEYFVSKKIPKHEATPNGMKSSERIPGLSPTCLLRGERLTKAESGLARDERDIREIKADVKEILRRVR